MEYQVGIVNNLYPTFAEFRNKECSLMEAWLCENAGRYRFIIGTSLCEIGVSFIEFADALAFSLLFHHCLEPGIWEYGE